MSYLPPPAEYALMNIAHFIEKFKIGARSVRMLILLKRIFSLGVQKEKEAHRLVFQKYIERNSILDDLKK